MKNILQQLRAELRQNSDEQTRLGANRYFKEAIQLFGVKTATVSTIGKKHYDKVKTKTKAEIFAICEELWQSGYLEESFIPVDVVPDIAEFDVCQTPFYEMMQQGSAAKIQKVVQMIEISEMTGDAASILKASPGASMLMLHRLLVGTDGKPLAYTRLMGDGKKYKLQTEMIQIV